MSGDKEGIIHNNSVSACFLSRVCVYVRVCMCTRAREYVRVCLCARTVIVIVIAIAIVIVIVIVIVTVILIVIAIVIAIAIAIAIVIVTVIVIVIVTVIVLVLVIVIVMVIVMVGHAMDVAGFRDLGSIDIGVRIDPYDSGVWPCLEHACHRSCSQMNSHTMQRISGLMPRRRMQWQ